MEISKMELIDAYGLLVQIAAQWRDNLYQQDERVTTKPLLELQKWFIKRLK